MAPTAHPPAIHTLIGLCPDLPHAVVKAAARAVVARRPSVEHAEDWGELVRAEAEAQMRPTLRPVLNATGVVLHTNLGRAPLGEGAKRQVMAVADQWSTLEFDVVTGGRGDRLAGVGPRLQQMFGVEAAIAVNNCAGAVLLALSALSAGKEVIVSRGELVEIGGAFRIPDVITACGAKLREVGTTNRTRIADYAAAIGPDTG